MISIRSLRTLAIMEGISYVAFAITMPLKYGLDILWPNKIVGMAHGILFILYVVGMIIGWQKFKWPLKNLAILLVASLVPLMPFFVEKKYIVDKRSPEQPLKRVSRIKTQTAHPQ